MMTGYFIDTLEMLRPYLIGGIVATIALYGSYLYFDRDYKNNLRCTSCHKKMFSTCQDDRLSDVKIQQRLEWLQYRVKTGRVSEEI